MLSSCEAWMPFPRPSFPLVESVRANPLSLWATFSAIGGLVDRSDRFPRDGSRWQDRLGRPQAVRSLGSHRFKSEPMGDQGKVWRGHWWKRWKSMTWRLLLFAAAVRWTAQMDMEPVRNNPTANELDTASWMWYPTRPGKASAQSCKFVNESFSQWMIRQTSRDGFENMAPYVDRSAVKKYAQIAATYLKVPRTYATFTWSNVRTILNYPFSSSFAFKALHGHGMSWLMIDGKMYESGTLRPSTGPRLDPGFLKRQAVKWMKQCYHCNDERQYAMVRRGVILEEILGGGFATELRVYMFHGEPYLLEIREHVPTDFGKIKEHFSIINNGDDPLEPANIQLEHSKAYISNSTMRDVFRASRDLTRNFRFVSVHFYYVKSTLYFKELDFSPEGRKDMLNEFYNVHRDTMVLCPRHG